MGTTPPWSARKISSQSNNVKPDPFQISFSTAYSSGLRWALAAFGAALPMRSEPRTVGDTEGRVQLEEKC